MKKVISILTIVVALSGCDEAELESALQTSAQTISSLDINVSCTVDYTNGRDEQFVDWNLFTKSYSARCVGLPEVSSIGRVCDYKNRCDRQKLIYDISQKSTNVYRLVDVRGTISHDSNKPKFVEIFSVYKNKLYLNLIELKKEK